MNTLGCVVGINHVGVLGDSSEEPVAADCWDKMKEVWVFLKL